MSILLYEEHGDEGEVAVLENNSLAEFVRIGGETHVKAESIYLAKVGRAMQNLEAVFVSLTPAQEGFLPLREWRSDAKLIPGQGVLLQVKRPPIGGKAAHMTGDIALTGRFVVYLPLGKRDRVSRRIASKEERAGLIQKARELPRSEGAFIMRGESIHADLQAIAEEAAALTDTWRRVQEGAAGVSAPRLIKDAPHPVVRLMRDLRMQPEKIITNVPKSLPSMGVPVSEAGAPMLLYNIREKLRRSLRRKVLLKSGASLMIDPCEAMTVIDVNSSQNVKKAGQGAAALQVNLEATAEIARLLRLRGVGGIVLIDFIDVDSDDKREMVLSALKAALQNDRVKTVVHGFTKLGLVEMTRTRSDEKLEAERGVCPACGGAGIIIHEKEPSIDA